jgi:hypothetical protein
MKFGVQSRVCSATEIEQLEPLRKWLARKIRLSIGRKQGVGSFQGLVSKPLFGLWPIF